MSDHDDVFRRAEELDALRSFYGEDLLLDADNDNDNEVNACDIVNGPWRIRVAPRIILEIHLPSTYPSSGTPTPFLRSPQWALDEGRRSDILAELMAMYVPDMECAIMWAEHCRAELDDGNDDGGCDYHDDDDDNAEHDSVDVDESAAAARDVSGGKQESCTKTFVPPSSKFGQPIRHFDAAVVMEDSNRRPIHRGKPFHPPKSGPSELMLAHVANVTSMDNVNWVLAELLFNDKRVAKATHNMIAYRFYDKERECMVSDNDDDGEKGSGAKLAALLEMSDAMDVIVIVSRWYGGIHLGPARFKHIASTARDALVEGGFIGDGNAEAEGNGGGTGGGKRSKGRK